MKPGDKFAVNLNEHVVAEAVVIDIEDGKVTLDIPATRIVMGVKSSLTDLPDSAPEKDRILLGDDSSATHNSSNPNNSGTSDNTQGTTGAPVPVPVAEVAAPNGVPPDAVGEGLANVKLQEME